MSIEERLARVEKILDARGLDWDHPRVADEPAKEAEPEPEHPAGPKPDPGEGYRILGKDPLEELQPGDEYEGVAGQWVKSVNASTHRKQNPCMCYRRKIEVAADHPPPAKPKLWRILDDKEIIQAGEWYNAKVNKPGKWPPHGGWVQLEDNDISMLGSPAGNFPRLLWCREVTDDIETPKPAWEPKVGDWVKLTRPEDWKACKNPEWVPAMHQYHGQVMKVSQFEQRYGAWVATFEGTDWFFNRDWISPAEPPEPEYRKPVLPADAWKECEFSIDGNEWTEGKLRGYAGCFWQSAFGELVGVKWWNHCRIKKDA
jgi:hypothetical protein